MIGGPLRAAQAAGDHWGRATKACIEALGPLPAGVNFGVVYVTEGFADDLSSIATFLKETTGVSHWVGAVGLGVFGPLGEVRGRPGMVVLVGQLPDGAVRLFEWPGADAGNAFLAEHGTWLRAQAAVTGLVHGDPQTPAVGSLLAGLAEASGAFVVGGLTAAGQAPTQLSGRPVAGGLSGVLFGDQILLATGLTQGCAPIGPPHRVTQAVENVVMTLDGRTALEMMKEEAGELLSRDLRAAAGLIHVGLPIAGADTHGYVVRGLLAIDPQRGWLAVAETLATGDRVMFVRRDPNGARQDMTQMLAGLARRVDGRTIRGGIYAACVSRGAHMFGHDGREIEMIHEALGEFPLIGFAANGEFCHDRLYGYTGVLALFLS
jgi:small ligand-binding sensory domain FIST